MSDYFHKSIPLWSRRNRTCFCPKAPASMVTATLKGVRHAGYIIPSLTFQSWTGIDQGTQADRSQTCHTNDSNFTSKQLLGINMLCEGGHTRISLALEMAGWMHSKKRLHFAQENLSLLHQPAQAVRTHAFLSNWDSQMSQTKTIHGTRYSNPNNIPVIRETKPT